MIALGADHAGFELKEKIKTLLNSMGIPFQDFGTTSTDSTDYPDYAHLVARAVETGKADRAILVCGTGIGMEMAANRHHGVRAAAVESVEAARLTRLHNDANVLALGARLTTWDLAQDIIRTFLNTQFEGGRHQRRVDKIEFPTNS